MGKVNKQTNWKPHQIISDEVLQIGRFKVHHETVLSGNKEYPYSFIESKDSVAVLGFTDENIVLIEQYRHAVDSFLYEIPGGSIETGETPLLAARRELNEETGYEAITIKEIGVFYPVPGSMSEKCYLYLAKCRKKTGIKTDPLERIRLKLVSRDEFQNLIVGNKFRQSMGLVAWLYYLITGEDNI